MGLRKRKPDPISDRARQLKAEIAALEGEIQRLNAGLADAKTQPKLRSTALPWRPNHPPAPTPPPPVPNPVFEAVDHAGMNHAGEPETTPAHYNAMGVRKYDLVAAWHRLRNLFHSPPPDNPKLINLLAAGNFQGLRPLRYEKRVARNRVIFLMIFLLFVLYAIITMLVRNH